MQHKSEKMAQVAIDHGWRAQVKPTIPDSKCYEEIIWNVYCVRDKETLHVVFKGNAQIESTYTYGVRVTHPPHKAAVMTIITGEPSVKLKGLSRQEKEALVETRQIPFEKDTPALQILLAVLGKQVTWIRKIDGEVISCVVLKEYNLGNKYFRVYPSKTGRRILEWLDPEGFHAVALEQIIEVA